MITRPTDTTASLDLERLRRLPPGRDVWQLAVVCGPQWILPKLPDGTPELPRIALCRSQATGEIAMGAPGMPSRAGDPLAPLALNAIADLARSPGSDGRVARPAVLEVTDEALQAAIVEPLGELGIEVVLVDRIEALDEVVASMREDLGGPMATIRCFAPDVSLERMASYAEAAVAFHDAAPWNHLADVDLLHVESRGAPEDMRWFVALGAAQFEFGIGFFHGVHDFEVLRDSSGERPPAAWLKQPRWSFTFDPPHDIPLTQYELWERHGFPCTSDGRLPLLLALRSDATNEPADESRLEFLEALLRALNQTTEDELDSGRWLHRVRVAGKERTITLAIPALLAEQKLPGITRATHDPREPFDRRLMEREMAKIGRMLNQEGMTVAQLNARLAATGGKLPDLPASADAREQAQALYYDALEAKGRLRIKRAREALRLWPDCADALVLLGEGMSDQKRARAFFEQALSASERALGRESFIEHRGHFWGVFETRPYMRARYALADLAWHEGEHDAAIAHWLGMLDLNPNDNMGVRDLLIPRLIERDRDEEAREVIARYSEDRGSVLRFAAALLAFRSLGKCEEADRVLARAVHANAHVVKYLLAPSQLPDRMPSAFALGSEDEAVIVAAMLHHVWRGTPGGEDWLRAHRREAKKARERGRKR